MLSGVRSLLVGTLALACGTASGQGLEAKCLGGVLSLYVENDLFYDTDRNYTSGVRLAWVSPDLDDYVRDECVPGWLRPVNEQVRDFFALHLAPARERNMTVMLGQAMYTPGRAAADRPHSRSGTSPACRSSPSASTARSPPAAAPTRSRTTA
jgi:hypothetical protein